MDIKFNTLCDPEYLKCGDSEMGLNILFSNFSIIFQCLCMWQYRIQATANTGTCSANFKTLDCLNRGFEPHDIPMIEQKL